MDSREQGAKLVKRLGLNFPVLSDAKAKTIDAYGVRNKGEEFAVPAIFIVRKDKTIAWSHVGESKSDRPTLDRIVHEVGKAR